MKKIKFIFSYFIFLALLNSCGSLSDAGKVLRNEKTRTTDEFLVKKKEPLTLPPDFNEIPQPGSDKNSSKINDNKIKKILKKSDFETKTLKGKSSSTEESILNRIKK